MKTLTVAVVVALGLSVAFALLALYSPLKSLPSPATCTIEMTAASCQYVLAQSKAQIAAAQFPFWLYQSEWQMAEGFTVVALLSLLAMIKRPKFSWLDRPLAPRFPKQLLTVLVLVGALAFGSFALIDASYHIWSFSRDVVSLFHFQTIQTRGSSYGVVAFAVWGLTVLGLSLGWGFVRAMKTFGLPAVLFLTTVLLVFDSTEMTSHVTNFVAWSMGGIDVASNWLVLTVALFLTLLGYAPSLLLSS